MAYQYLVNEIITQGWAGHRALSSTPVIKCTEYLILRDTITLCCLLTEIPVLKVLS